MWKLTDEHTAKEENPESNEVTEVKRANFINKHLHKVDSLKQLIGQYPAPGEAYFLFSMKSFNAFTFIVYIIKHVGVVDELHLSTYSLNERIVNSLVKWYDKNAIKQISITISDSIRYRVPKVNDMLQLYAKDRNMSVHYAWNHSKITLIRVGSHYFVIEGSGNFSENAMHEQYFWTNDQEVYLFRKMCMNHMVK